MTTQGPSPDPLSDEAPLMAGPNAPEQPKQGRKPRLVEYGLVAVMSGVLGVMAVPDMAPDVSNMDGLAELTRLQAKLEVYRSALEEYRADHHVYPGYKPGRAGAWLHGAPSGVDFKRQMILWSDEWGQVGQLIVGRRELGPYFERGLPDNPVNGLESVRILRDNESFPEVPSGETGWYFKPATGELRANCAGTSVITGEPYFDL